ncbi:hypothetical protein [Sinomonas gamaensis]|uniref:hypothetical protein n=1 Tax=Sinomonas gamaensis TaxID=2565624 RepID=UPI0011085C97|nr:hypothetical protein [Sinomonas gamaensis]
MNKVELRPHDNENLDDDSIESHDTANGALWPRTVGEMFVFADALGLEASSVMAALEKVYAARPVAA